ncbi:hypothetical protein Syun_021136 [Stephania yunnanensis]|uniref:Uncharacterized protein n=1 Tax=Stephania yunnanensis TaxID=152371 RepID=A0AAP0NQF7_9MAGN
MVQRRVTLVHYNNQHRQILSISTIRWLIEEAVARDRVRDPVECTDKDNDLVMHRDKDMDMIHLDRDFNVSVWAYGQPGGGWCVPCLEVTEEPNSSRRSPACRGGAQLVTEEPSLSRRNLAL